MKMKKRVKAGLLALLLSVSLAGCGGNSDGEVSKDNEMDQIVIETDNTEEDQNTKNGQTDNSGAEDFLGMWGCGRASMRISESAQGYEIVISWASSAFENSEWIYPCAFNPETCQLICDGEGTKTDYLYADDAEEPVITEIYHDGSAVFSFSDGSIVWDDQKENAGVDMYFVQ